MGHEVTLVTFRDPDDNSGAPESAFEGRTEWLPMGVTSRLWSPYRTHRLFFRAANLYNERALSQLRSLLTAVDADLLWCEYSATMPLAHHVVVRDGFDCAVVCREHNDEVRHQLDQRYVEYILSDARVPSLSTVKATLTDLVGTIRCESLLFETADVVAPISKRDCQTFAKRHDSDVITHIPFHSPKELPQHEGQETDQLDAVFLGSTFKYVLNEEGATFLASDLVPELQHRNIDVRIHLLGDSPPAVAQDVDDRWLQCHGFVNDLDAFLNNMDISLVPVFHGTGFKVKCYESLRRGFPVIASPRALDEFDGTNGETYVEATTATEFADALERLQDVALRKEMGAAAAAQTDRSFCRKRTISVLETLLNGL